MLNTRVTYGTTWVSPSTGLSAAAEFLLIFQLYQEEKKRLTTTDEVEGTALSTVRGEHNQHEINAPLYTFTWRSDKQGSNQATTIQQ